MVTSALLLTSRKLNFKRVLWSEAIRKGGPDAHWPQDSLPGGWDAGKGLVMAPRHGHCGETVPPCGVHMVLAGEPASPRRHLFSFSSERLQFSNDPLSFLRHCAPSHGRNNLRDATSGVRAGVPSSTLVGILTPQLTLRLDARMCLLTEVAKYVPDSLTMHLRASLYFLKPTVLTAEGPAATDLKSEHRCQGQ